MASCYPLDGTARAAERRMIMAKCTGNRCPMQYGYKVEECNDTDCPYRTEPITNADKIRAMTDEELAMWMSECNAFGENAEASQWLPWLKQPAEMPGDDC